MLRAGEQSEVGRAKRCQEGPLLIEEAAPTLRKEREGWGTWHLGIWSRI